MTTLIIPMAGSGSRFRAAGCSVPKPLIDIRGKPMIAHVIENIRPKNSRLILIARREDAESHPQAFAHLTATYGATFILLDAPTEGAACTILHAESELNTPTPILIANSDQLIDLSIEDFLTDATSRNLDGSILTFRDPTQNPKWSYAKVENGLVTQTREKSPISPHATIGIYWFRQGQNLIKAIREMIAANDHTNNEFYLCPAYNYLIRHHQKIGIYDIPPSAMHGLGTPEDLTTYLTTP